VRVASRLVEDAEFLIHGVLHCSEPSCQQEYPVLDGIPILVPNVRAYLADNFFHLTLRDDLPEALQSLLGDASGPGTPYDATRQHLSTYAWDHYEDLSPDAPAEAPGPGALSRCLEEGLTLIGAEDGVPAPILDIGCAVGRSAFDLAARADGPVLGVDVNFAMLQVAQGVLRDGAVRYPRRRVGLVYDRRQFPLAPPGRERVDFWACDALALPFRAGLFALASAFNVLDCVATPSGFLQSLAGVLQPKAKALLSTPYDWSANVTPVEAWIGGHSQRGPEQGASEPLLRRLLDPTQGRPEGLGGLRLLGEKERVPWQARIHERSTVAYAAHLVAVEVGHS
jgi:SAM-dependent methyltransferase